MCVLEKTPRSITVRLTNARWNRLMELEALKKNFDNGNIKGNG